MASIKILKLYMILKVLKWLDKNWLTSIKILKLYMILKVLIEMAYIKILKLYMILMVLIEMDNHVRTNDKYNHEDFDRNGLHKDTKTLYDPNGFNRNGSIM